MNFNPSRYQKYNISKICTNTLDSRLPEYIVFGTVMFYKGAGGPRTQGGRGEGELEEGVEVEIRGGGQGPRWGQTREGA